MGEKQHRILNLIMIFILMVSVFLTARKGAEYVSVGGFSLHKNSDQGIEKPCVVIDAGHGGNDPGKIGCNQALEKDVNLQIAGKLKMFLEAADLKVVMTREDDHGLYDESAKNKKRQDMNRRIEIIEREDPILVVSVHQNSYPVESVSGPQVFYYQSSEKSKKLAQILQSQLKQLVPQSKREAKGNDSYFLLKKTSKPIVITECGFLSNQKEAEKLCNPVYQEQIAWRLHLGILEYISTGQTMENVVESAQ